jgi:hypothetical protein
MELHPQPKSSRHGRVGISVDGAFKIKIYLNPKIIGVGELFELLLPPARRLAIGRQSSSMMSFGMIQ